MMINGVLRHAITAIFFFFYENGPKWMCILPYFSKIGFLNVDRVSNNLISIDDAPIIHYRDVPFLSDIRIRLLAEGLLVRTVRKEPVTFPTPTKPPTWSENLYRQNGCRMRTDFFDSFEKRHSHMELAGFGSSWCTENVMELENVLRLPTIDIAKANKKNVASFYWVNKTVQSIAEVSIADSKDGESDEIDCDYNVVKSRHLHQKLRSLRKGPIVDYNSEYARLNWLRGEFFHYQKLSPHRWRYVICICGFTPW